MFKITARSSEMKNKITVLFFATLKGLAGADKFLVELPQGSNVQDLKSHLVGQIPELIPAIEFALVSVNREFAFDEDVLPEGAEVALFPPVSGGESQDYPTIFAITEDALDLNEILNQITLPTTGAACIFTGMVRALTRRDEPRETIQLEYEAYQPMAEAKMRQVAEEIRARWPSVEGMAIVQRVGRLEPGTPTVIIACSSAHRDTGVFDAARYGIDRLKEIVPVWKKEVGPLGETWVEGTYVPEPGE